MTDAIVPSEFIENRIYLIRGQKVMLDSDLAKPYEVPVKRLNEQVTRNIERFPGDFMSRLSPEEEERLKSQIATLGLTYGQRPRSRPRAFTEQGVAMLSSVLRGRRAIAVNIAIVRAFVKLRRLLSGNAELAKKLEKMEKQYDAQFRVVFRAIRESMKRSQTETPPSRRIGNVHIHIALFQIIWIT